MASTYWCILIHWIQSNYTTHKLKRKTYPPSPLRFVDDVSGSGLLRLFAKMEEEKRINFSTFARKNDEINGFVRLTLILQGGIILFFTRWTGLVSTRWWLKYRHRYQTFLDCSIITLRVETYQTKIRFICCGSFNNFHLLSFRNAKFIGTHWGDIVSDYPGGFVWTNLQERNRRERVIDNY